MAQFTLEPDLEERSVEVPIELARLFKQNRTLARWFAALSYSYRKDICDHVTEPKSAEARVRRAEQAAERMLLTMDGERELPPLLQLALRRVPEAARGWEAMTDTQRRAQLLAIYYYQSPEARERRVQKVVEEAVRVARKEASGSRQHSE